MIELHWIPGVLFGVILVVVAAALVRLARAVNRAVNTLHHVNETLRRDCGAELDD